MQSITRLRLKGCCAVARRYSTTLQSQSEVSMTAATKSLAAGIACGRRDALARAITLIESTRADHKAQSALLMNWLTQNRCEFSKKDAFSGGSTLRLGVAGPPGAGAKLRRHFLHSSASIYFHSLTLLLCPPLTLL